MALSLGCGGDATPVVTGFQRYVPAAGSAASIAYTAGITRYVGTAPPTETTTTGAVTTFTFDPAQGPVCMHGAPYRASVRDGASDDLLIFLQGGGACWTDFCLAVTAAPAGVPSMDLLRTTAENPLHDFDVLYLPYCDGSLFAGDHTVNNADGTPARIHHGLQNLSAALAAGFTRYPHPRRIVLAGSSGGGFGTILAAFLVRYVYPDAPLYVVDDAGIGVARTGDPAYLGRLLDDFGARAFIPADCANCTADGNITGLVDYFLAHDRNAHIAAISSWNDWVISSLFLMEPAATFQADLARATDALHAAHPDTYRRFFYAGTGHTTLLGNATGIVGTNLNAVDLPSGFAAQIGMVHIESMYVRAVNGVTVAQWLGAMLAGDATRWDDRLEATTPMP